MEEGPKKRGRKPKPAEEKVKRGRKKIAEEEIQARKKEGAPPLQISFVCGDDEAPVPVSTSESLNPFADHQTSSTVVPPRGQAPIRPSRSIAPLDESDDDELQPVQDQPRVDISSLTGSKCVELLGAHTTREQWPEKTDVACWNCTFEFDGIPIAVPKGLRHRKHFDKCYGVFCSFNCAKRYVMTQNDFDMWSQLQLLSLLHKRVLGCTVKVIPAPPRQALLRFGGYLSIDEYRKNNIVLPPQPDMFDPSVRRDTVQLLQQGCTPYFFTVHHTHSQNLAAEKADHRKEGYHRVKPLPGAENLLQSMGIVMS